MNKKNINCLCGIILFASMLLLGISCSKDNTPVIGQIYEDGVIAYIFQAGDPGYVSGQTYDGYKISTMEAGLAKVKVIRLMCVQSELFKLLQNMINYHSLTRKIFHN